MAKMSFAPWAESRIFPRRGEGAGKTDKIAGEGESMAYLKNKSPWPSIYVGTFDARARRPYARPAALAVFFALVLTSLLGALAVGPALSANNESWREKGTYLIMFEQDGCFYCQAWNERIGGIYGNTREGRFAPLKKIDIHDDDAPPNVKPVIFTPTFVLLVDGREVGRITGFTSEDFFWGLLGPMLAKNGYGGKRAGKASPRM
jgi:hypothetical protein